MWGGDRKGSLQGMGGVGRRQEVGFIWKAGGVVRRRHWGAGHLFPSLAAHEEGGNETEAAPRLA